MWIRILFKLGKYRKTFTNFLKKFPQKFGLRNKSYAKKMNIILLQVLLI
jgi:hypothetical protein